MRTSRGGTSTVIYRLRYKYSEGSYDDRVAWSIGNNIIIIINHTRRIKYYYVTSSS